MKFYYPAGDKVLNQLSINKHEPNEQRNNRAQIRKVS